MSSNLKKSGRRNGASLACMRGALHARGEIILRRPKQFFRLCKRTLALRGRGHNVMLVKLLLPSSACPSHHHQSLTVVKHH
jgi:hypothetical protein